MSFLNAAHELIAVVQLSPRPGQETIRLANTPLCTLLDYQQEDLICIPATTIFGQRSYAEFKDALRDAKGCTCTRKQLVPALPPKARYVEMHLHTQAACAYRIGWSNTRRLR